MSNERTITLRVNGREERGRFPAHRTLLEALREIGHTEVKCGCEKGDCGACAVLLDGMAVDSCLTLAWTAEGCGDHHRPRSRRPGGAAPRAAGVRRRRGRPVRVLHPGHRHRGEGDHRRAPGADGGRRPPRPERQPVPLHRGTRRCSRRSARRPPSSARGGAGNDRRHQRSPVAAQRPVPAGGPTAHPHRRPRQGRRPHPLRRRLRDARHAAHAGGPGRRGQRPGSCASTSRGRGALQGVACVLTAADLPDRARVHRHSGPGRPEAPGHRPADPGPGGGSGTSGSRSPSSRRRPATWRTTPWSWWRLELEPIPGVYDPVEAMQPGAPVVTEPDNIVAERRIRKGDVEAGFAEADVIVENTFRTPVPGACLPRTRGGARLGGRERRGQHPRLDPGDRALPPHRPTPSGCPTTRSASAAPWSAAVSAARKT